MPRSVRVLVVALAIGSAVTGCSSTAGVGHSTTVSPVPAPFTSSAAPAAVTASSPATTTAASPTTATSAAPKPASGSAITFTGRFSGKMTASACQSGMMQLDVDIDGQPTSYAGIIDADDFTFVAPNSAGFTLAKGAQKPKVSGGGTTFTVDHTKLVGILSNDTVIATGSVTCP